MPEDLCACDQREPIRGLTSTIVASKRTGGAWGKRAPADGTGAAVDLDAWRAEAGAALAMANAATLGPWTWDGLEQLVSGDAVVLYPCEVWHDTIEIQGTDGDKAFTSAARTGWPREAARVGVLADRCEALQAALSEALDVAESLLSVATTHCCMTSDSAKIDRLRSLLAEMTGAKGESR